jgi:hypothetical protein
MRISLYAINNPHPELARGARLSKHAGLAMRPNGLAETDAAPT